MNILNFVGRCAAAPESKQANGTTVVKFRLVRNEFAGKNDDQTNRERVVTIPFTAFGKKAEAIGTHVRKGDQLVITASVENNRFTDGAGIERFDYNFIVQEFEFGAPGDEKRRELARREPGLA